MKRFRHQLELLLLLTGILCASGPAAGESAPIQPATSASSPDWPNLKRDTWYFIGYQFAATGMLYALPEDITHFDRDNASFDQYWDNVTHPHWDEDDGFVNYVLHPYWGAAYYIRGRERNLSRWQSFWYSALLSTLYEYGAEAFFEPVSYQDLIVTPVLGSLIGELLFSPLREHIHAQETPLDWTDHTLLVLTDPLGALNQLTDSLLGRRTMVSVTRLNPARLHFADSYPGLGQRGMGTEQARADAPWGLIVHFSW
ncbi:DUF3943 domain-containing protein [Chitinolyticbacter albus]|uniref:DUF3943 domain-containing protein n=1 Tax=Chitinolyticbacter albus TaxID=2961951 RepID=UPI00210AEAB9|nr:DUF3943 domain-containing protein [Chitinolyticbacter albus]